MKLDKFITENRAEIDEFLGVNNPTYVAIALKGQVAKEFKNKERSFDYFEALMTSGMSQVEQNKHLLKLLHELRENKQKGIHPLMTFGIDTRLLMGKDKRKFFKLIESELNG